MEDNFVKKQQALFAKNVNDKKKKKEGLNYLSWVWAWTEFLKIFPDATYKRLPYTDDDNLGYMVHTEVTAGGVTREMWLAVMDFRKKAMKNKPYSIKQRKGEVHVAQATMFDVNNAYMRCLTKNLAMFGLGTYIYAGEDLPEAPVVYRVEKILKSIKGLPVASGLAIMQKKYPDLGLDSTVDMDGGAEIKKYVLENMPKESDKKAYGDETTVVAHEFTVGHVLRKSVKDKLFENVDEALKVAQKAKPEYASDTAINKSDFTRLETYLKKVSESIKHKEREGLEEKDN